MASLQNRLADYFIEKRLNIRTVGRKDVNVGDAVAYSTFAYWAIDHVLDGLNLAPNDIFVDLGCGKGRVVCSAATRHIKKSIGIELDTTLSEQARANAERMRHRAAPIDIINLPAQDADYQHITAIFMFNPFGPGTLTAVLERIANTLRDNPRVVRIAYVNPRLDQCFNDFADFGRYDFWRRQPSGRLKFDVSFWKSAGP